MNNGQVHFLMLKQKQFRINKKITIPDLLTE